MTRHGAHTAVTISAIVVAGTFGYRKFVTPQTAPSGGSFLIGFTVVFVTLGILADAAPALGGMFAALVAAGDLLANGKQLTTGIRSTLAKPTATALAPVAQLTAATTGVATPVPSGTGAYVPQGFAGKVASG